MSKPIEQTLEEIIAEQRKQLIAFKQWYDNLSPSNKCTVWPPAGSGAGKGLYDKSDDDIIDDFMRKQKQGKP